MQFKEGTTVYTHDEQKVGDIERFILDPRGQKIVGLVVRKGFLLTEDKVIPTNMVGTADADKVMLYADAGDPDNFPVFEETQYITPDESELEDEYSVSFPLYFYPLHGGTGWHNAYPVVMPQPVKERNIPSGTVPVKEGANVISSDGEHIGDVERVMTENKTDQITHFIISQGLFFKDEKVLPSRWVETARENELHLAVNTKTLKKLEDF